MLTEWIKSVLVCSILFSVVVYIAPNPDMKRYVQTAVGFVMIIVVLSPLLELSGEQDRLTFNLFSEALGTDIEDGDNEVYTAAMEEIVTTFADDEYGVRTQVDIMLSEELAITGMSVAIDYRYMSENGKTVSAALVQALRSGLAAEYDIDESMIVIL